MQRFFELDLEAIYPTPTPTRVAEAFFNRLYRKLHVDNFSLLITFYGPHRVGKSLAAVDFGHILDETFEPNMEQRIVYNAKALIAAFRDIRQQGIKGGAVIIDEAGSGELSSQRWYEEAAKIISAELQAVGYLNPCIFFVCQSFSFINTTARKLTHGVFEVKRTNNDYSNIKPFWIQNSPWATATNRRYPIFCENKNGVPRNVFKINNIKIGLAPDVIRLRYIEYSQKFKDQLLTSSESDLEALEILKQQKNVFVTGIDAIAEEVFNNKENYMISTGKGDIITVNDGLIRHAHELSWKDAKLVKAIVDNKLNFNKVQKE